MKRDLVIVGGGPAGYHCALQCARQGLKPLLIEKEALGGTGLRWGCLPVKQLMDGIREIKSARHRERTGEISLAPLTKDESETLLAACVRRMKKNSRRMEETLKAAGVEMLYGDAQFKSPHALEMKVNTAEQTTKKTIEFQRLVLATGTAPSPPPGVIIDGRNVITHREAVNLTTPPASLVMLGGDVEGLEFASLFSEMGTKVIVLEMQSKMLAGFDPDLTQPLLKRLEANGVQLVTGARVEGVNLVPAGVEVVTDSGKAYEAELAMVAMTRRPVVPEGLENLGLALVEERLPVNDLCGTVVPHVHCIGDLNGRMEMAHAALQQGIFLAEFLAGGQEPVGQYEALPWVIFGLPQCGGAGAQEKDLVDKGIAYRKSLVHWHDTWRGFGQEGTQGCLKILVSAEDALLGIWLTGENIGEMAALAGVIVSQKFTLRQVKEQLWVHPSLTEALLQAVLQLI